MFVLLALMIAVLLVDRLIGWRTATRLAPTITAKGSEPRVAILPFADMSPEKNQDYFCEGAAEEIINALCAVNGLRVASRSASFQLKNRALGAREVADCSRPIVPGRQRAQGRRPPAHHGAADQCGGRLPSLVETFDRNVEDIFAVQEEIARHIVAALRVNLLATDASRMKRRGTKNAAAYELYLRGRQLLNKEKEAEQRAAVEMFREAVRLDPAFADAHAGLADVLTQLLRQRNTVSGAAPADAVAASLRAIELAPDLPDAYIARGNALLLTGELDEAQHAFERALALDPRHFHAHYWFATWAVRRHTASPQTITSWRSSPAR